MSTFTFFASCPVYLEELLREELEGSGASEISITHGGVMFSGTLETAYRVCLWSRIANNILFPLVSFDAEKPEDIRAAAEGFEWENHFTVESTIASDATLSGSKICTPDYAALSVKDGVVDRFRKLTGKRPSVDSSSPDIRLNLHISGKRGAIALNLSGEGLHRRGYRIQSVKAGMRENTAAAMLLRAGWRTGQQGRRFHDPMCGSGTLVIEAAMIAAGIAPALGRSRFGFEKWLHHKPDLWDKLLAEAEKRRADGTAAVTAVSGSSGLPLFTGCDRDPRAVTAARTNMAASPAAELLSSGAAAFSRADFFQSPAPATGGSEQPSGIARPEDTPLAAVNPPYGERLNSEDDMMLFYRRMGETIKRNYRGWQISILTSEKSFAESTALRAEKLNTIYNGGIRCTLAHFRIYNDNPAASAKNPARRENNLWPEVEDLSPGSTMVYNRLKKNSRRLKKWLKNSGTSCYRLYDADMPEYSAAVDIYEGKVIIQEYAAPATIDPVAASGRLRELVLAVQAYMLLSEKDILLKQRKKQRGRNQYSASGRGKKSVPDRLIVRESGLRFFIDTESYIDTGIFLDSRPLRRLIRENSDKKSFLNLFCYTGTASVYAAAGGAYSTASVDTSGTYLEWAEANMRLNGYTGGAHSYVKADCISWLKTTLGRWDLIYLDPPTFSNSKDRSSDFDLQRDHAELIRLAAGKLAEGGLLIFCNNFRRFKMDSELQKEFLIEEISDRTIDPDFERRKSIHRSWEIRAGVSASESNV